MLTQQTQKTDGSGSGPASEIKQTTNLIMTEKEIFIYNKRSTNYDTYSIPIKTRFGCSMHAARRVTNQPDIV